MATRYIFTTSRPRKMKKKNHKKRKKERLLKGATNAMQESSDLSLMVASAETVLKAVSDDRMEQILLQWVGNLSEERQDRFLKKTRSIVRNGIHPHNSTFHYLIVRAPAIDFLYKSVTNVLSLIQHCRYYLDGDTEITFIKSFVNGVLVERETVRDAAGNMQWSPDHDAVVAAIGEKNPQFLEGICFKLDDNGIYNNGQKRAVHTPMHINKFKELFYAMVETLHNDFVLLEQEPRQRFEEEIIPPFAAMVHKQKMATFEFEIVVDGVVKRVLHCSPLAN